MVRENGTYQGSQKAEQSDSSIQISKADWDFERISRRAYQLYEQRGRQEGRDLEDCWARNANWMLDREHNHTNRRSGMGSGCIFRNP
jgi:hypothetical protein